MRAGSLADVRVVDVTGNVAGPFATRILAELGADVVKVERPGSGDDTRSWGPPTWNGHGLSFLDLNRDKRSVVLDLTTDEGQARLHDLVADADVFVQNMRPGSLAKLGFGPDALLERHPGLIYCEISGYGNTGPKAEDPAFDPLLQAFTGLMSLIGEDGRPPARIPVAVLDKGAGMWAVIGILDALRQRERTGEGAIVRTSLLETALSWESMQIMSYLATGELPQRLGSGQAGIGSYGAFATADGHVLVAAGNDRLWARLCDALDAGDLAADARFATNSDRVRHRAELTAELERRLGEYTTAEAIERIAAAGVPVGPVNDIAAALAEPQVQAIGAVAPVEHPDIPDLHGLMLPVHVSNAPHHPTRPAPGHGEHTEAVFDELDARRRDAAAQEEEGPR